MSNPTGCLTRQIFDPVASFTSRATHPGGTPPASDGITHQLDLLEHAAEMMATGALTEEQAQTLSRQIMRSVP
jgi:hypothetical protein